MLIENCFSLSFDYFHINLLQLLCSGAKVHLIYNELYTSLCSLTDGILDECFDFS